MERSKILTRVLDVGTLGLLVLGLWGRPQKVLARVFVWDAFRHWDDALMRPGWAYLQGLKLNVDVVSSWGLGVVMAVSHAAKLLGGFDDSHVLAVLVAMAVVYYAALYFFLKDWLRSAILSSALVAMAVKLQMFHTGIAPLAWIYPEDTPVRLWLDLAALWFLWKHSQGGGIRFLAAASTATGAALAWQLTTGLSLLVAFWAYMIFLLRDPEYRRTMVSDFQGVRRMAFLLACPAAVMLLALFFLQGGVIFQAVFWKNTFEPLVLFVQGQGTVPIFRCLYDRHFFAFIAGFAVPLIYAGTLLVAVGREEAFVFAVCVYGLVLYVHYLAQGTISHYYAVGIPLVFVLGFWLSQVISRCSVKLRAPALGLVLFLFWGALLTNIYFIYYPNLFAFSRMNWQPEINLFQSEFQLTGDADMIHSLVPSGRRAAVISSFETALLMQAGRSPFFYDGPLVESQRPDLKTFAGTSLWTKGRFWRAIRQIDQAKPDYIFVEKRLLGRWPPELVQSYPGIFIVLKYVTQHYVPQQQGALLIAMKRT